MNADKNSDVTTRVNNPRPVNNRPYKFFAG